VPILPQITTVHILSDMATGDVWSTTPSVNNGGGFGVLGNLIAYFSTTITTYTPIVHGSIASPGTRGTILNAGVNWSTACGGSSCVGAYVLDTTQSPNVRFIIESDAGSGLARITNPFVVGASPVPAYGIPANGDAITVGRGPSFNAYSLNVTNPGATSAAVPTSYQLLTFSAPGGFSQIALGGNTWLLDVTLAPNTHLNSQSLGIAEFSIFNNCFFGSQAAYSGTGLFVGGATEGNATIFTNDTRLDGDVILGSDTDNFGNVFIQRAYSAVANYVTGPGSTFYFLEGIYGQPLFYGPGGLALSFGSKAVFSGSPTVIPDSYLTSLIVIGANYQTNSFWFNESTGAWVGPVTVSVANAVAHGALWDPATGSAFGIVY
jgi:hypothetical protein